MTLYADLSINRTQSAGSIYMNRVTNCDRSVMTSAMVSVYHVKDTAGRVATVSHRYGDGAVELLRKALNALHEKEEHGD